MSSKPSLYLDGKSKCASVALIYVDTPYLKKNKVHAVCIDEPTFDLVIGEVDGSRCKCNPDLEWKFDAVSTLMTRSQEKNMKKTRSPLKVYVGSEEVDVTPSLLKELQSQDPTLTTVMKLQSTDVLSRGMYKSWYECKEGILYRMFQSGDKKQVYD